MAEKKQRRGRPVTGHERITVSITPEQRKWLDGTAEHRGWDRSQIVREILKKAMEVENEPR